MQDPGPRILILSSQGLYLGNDFFQQPLKGLPRGVLLLHQPQQVAKGAFPICQLLGRRRLQVEEEQFKTGHKAAQRRR